MHATVHATQSFAGPWWLAVVVVEASAHDVLEPVLRELPARLTPAAGPPDSTAVDFGPMVRTGTVGCLALRWQAGAPAAVARTNADVATMVGELRLAEIGANSTQLTLTGQFVPAPAASRFAVESVAAQRGCDEVVERLARSIEDAVADQIGTRSPYDGRY